MADPVGPLGIRELVDQHYELLYRYAYRLSGSAADAEDLTQETFCTAQQKLAQLRNAASARSWLCTILRHCFLKGFRSARVVSFASLETLADDPEAAGDPADDMDLEKLQRVLDALPEPFRTPLILFYFEEFSYRDIAEQMGVPLGTVMSRLARAKRHLRAGLAAEPAPSTDSTGVR
jgi:RNA polymerase sigma-70 factor (ECF subfamily)